MYLTFNIFINFPAGHFTILIDFVIVSVYFDTSFYKEHKNDYTYFILRC